MHDIYNSHSKQKTTSVYIRINMDNIENVNMLQIQVITTSNNEQRIRRRAFCKKMAMPNRE